MALARFPLLLHRKNNLFHFCKLITFVQIRRTLCLSEIAKFNWSRVKYVNCKDSTSYRLCAGVSSASKAQNVLVQLIKYGQSLKLMTHLNRNLNTVVSHSADDENDSI